MRQQHAAPPAERELDGATVTPADPRGEHQARGRGPYQRPPRQSEVKARVKGPPARERIPPPARPGGDPPRRKRRGRGRLPPRNRLQHALDERDSPRVRELLLHGRRVGQRMEAARREKQAQADPPPHAYRPGPPCSHQSHDSESAPPPPPRQQAAGSLEAIAVRNAAPIPLAWAESLDWPPAARELLVAAAAPERQRPGSPRPGAASPAAREQRKRLLEWEAARDRQEAERLRELDSPAALAERVRSGELDLRELLRQAPGKAARQELVDGFGSDLRCLNLAEARLEGLDLSGKDFGGSNLREARLGGSRMDAASFAFADLRRADLRACSARATGFEGAWMDGARVTHADLTEARLNAARLYDADFSGSRLAAVAMPGARMNSPAGGWGGTRISYDFRRHAGAAVYPFPPEIARAAAAPGRPGRQPSRTELG